jgi:putative membrane protein
MRPGVHELFQGTLAALVTPDDNKGTALMTQRSICVTSTFAMVSALTWGCAGDPKRSEVPGGEVEVAPTMKSRLPAGEVSAPAPNGQPAGMPPADPGPTGLNTGSNQGNALAAPTGASPPAMAMLSEGQIARIADLVNTAEIDQAKLAQAKARNGRVKAFAAMMIKHHGQAKTEQARLTRQLNISSADSMDAATLQGDGRTTLAALKDTPAADFDAAYIDSQVTAHQKALTIIDERLMPSAKSDGVINALKLAREAVASHLEQAKALQGELAKTR